MAYGKLEVAIDMRNRCVKFFLQNCYPLKRPNSSKNLKIRRATATKTTTTEEAALRAAQQEAADHTEEAEEGDAPCLLIHGILYLTFCNVQLSDQIFHSTP